MLKVESSGDQTRITRALLKPDGTPTAVLEAIYAVWRGGGVIAGTSAGAAVQSETMISVSGFPDDSIDEGMDALDFGLTKSIEQAARRGLLVTRGLGFVRSGIIDQHFSQYRGRLGRLARAAIEEKIRFGFGIDENAALVVATDGTMEILGPGYVTIVDTAGATCQDGPLGCLIAGAYITCLGHGDRFDPKTGKATVHPDKKKIEPGQERNNGNFQIPDIAGRGAALHALIEGLADNTSRKQIGITLKHNRHYGHGYRHTFSKTDQTFGYKGIVKGFGEVSVTHVRLDISPVALTLRPPETGLPLDLPQGPSRKMLEAISFRGIMIADDQGRFRPDAPVTRGELASAIAQTIRLEPARGAPPAITDVLASSSEADEISLVVTAGLMTTEGGSFHPAEPISRQEAATVLVRLAERYRSEVLSAKPIEFKDSQAIAPRHRDAAFAAYRENLLKTNVESFRPLATLTREEAAESLHKIIGLPLGDSISIGAALPVRAAENSIGAALPAKRAENKLPDQAKNILEKASDFELYLLDPSKRVDKANETTSLCGWKVLGKKTVGDAETRKELLAAVERDIDTAGRSANCFVPHHPIRATHEGKTVDLVICFKCHWVYVYVDSKCVAELVAATNSRPLLDKILSDAEVLPMTKWKD